MDGLKVSVILPTYNRACLLGRAMKSILAQTYSNLELLIIDDASTDNTESVVKGFQDNRVRYIRHMRRQGGAAARNTGINASSGELIAFQDSDDEWLLEKLEKQVGKLQRNSSIGVVFCGFAKWNGKVTAYVPQKSINIIDGDISSQILKGNFVGTPTMLIRREVLKRSGLFDRNLPRLQDWELVIRLAGICRFCFINEPLVMVYETHERISNNQQALVIAMEYILSKHNDKFLLHHSAMSDNLYKLGILFSEKGDIQHSRSSLTQSIKMNPRNIKASFLLAFTFLGENATRFLIRLKRRFTSHFRF